MDSEQQKKINEMSLAFIKTLPEPLIFHTYTVGHDSLLTGKFLKGIESLNDQEHEVEDGIDVLFSGCSITMGSGLDRLSDSWSHLMYEYIKKDYPINGYKNISLGGSSVIDIIINVIKYIYSYKTPQYIFLLLPNFGRDLHKFAGNNELSTKFLYNIYYIFDRICKEKNIKVISFTWSDNVVGVTDWIPSVEETYGKEVKDLFLNFDTFYEINKKDFAKNVFDYINNNKDAQGIIGNDDSHPGSAIHFGYYKEMERIYNAL